MNNTLHSNSKGKVLIPTNDQRCPFLIRTTEDKEYIYLVVKKDGTLSGDGMYGEELVKYFPDIDLKDIETLTQEAQ